MSVSPDHCFTDVCKRLFNTPGVTLLSHGKQPIEVYLRIRDTHTSGYDSCLVRAGDRVLRAIPPIFSQAFRGRHEEEHFAFSKIYDKESLQKEIFVESVVPILENFFAGQDSLIFAYGVTNSGKTYTVTGEYVHV